jgi:two-component sensor histidine kinase
LDATGRFRCGFTAPNAPDDNFADRPYFGEALAATGPVIGEYTVGRASGRSVLPIALALHDKAGNVDGVIVASLDLIWLDTILKQRGLPPGGSVTVADRNGVIIAREPLPDRFIGTRIPAPYLRLLTAPGYGSEEVMSQDGTRRILGYVPLSEPPVGLYVSAGLSAESSFETIHRATWAGVALAIAGAIATLLATWTMGNRVFVQPIQTVTGALRMWRAGDLKARTSFDAGSGEIGELGAELDRLMDALARAQEQRTLLAEELEHRVKNTLATVRALAVSTMDGRAPAAELLPAFLARLNSLATAHEILTQERWESADLRRLLTFVFKPLVADVDSRMRLDGPDLELPPGEALGLAMVMHELCTNALKYGALKDGSAGDGGAAGHVALNWHIDETDGQRRLRMTWRESGGPAVAPPSGKTGFGTRLIGRALSGYGYATLEYDPAGVICRVEIPLAELGGAEP